MTTPYDFKEIERCEDCFVPSITYENRYHTVTIFYDDPDTNERTIDVKTHGQAFALAVVSNTVYVRDDALTSFEPGKIHKVIRYLETTGRSAAKLQELLDGPLPHLRFET